MYDTFSNIGVTSILIGIIINYMQTPIATLSAMANTPCGLLCVYKVNIYKFPYVSNTPIPMCLGRTNIVLKITSEVTRKEYCDVMEKVINKKITTRPNDVKYTEIRLNEFEKLTGTLCMNGLKFDTTKRYSILINGKYKQDSDFDNYTVRNIRFSDSRNIRIGNSL